MPLGRVPSHMPQILHGYDERRWDYEYDGGMQGDIGTPTGVQGLEWAHGGGHTRRTLYEGVGAGRKSS